MIGASLKCCLAIVVAIGLVWLSPLAFYGPRAALILDFCVAVTIFFIVDSNTDNHPPRSRRSTTLWAYEEHTGEYKRVYFNHKEGNRTDNSTHASRLDYRLSIIQGLDLDKRKRTISLLIAVICLIISYSISQYDFVPHYGALLAGWVASIFFIMISFDHANRLDLLDRPENEVGPPPVVDPGPTTAQDLTIDQIEALLKGQSAHRYSAEA